VLELDILGCGSESSSKLGFRSPCPNIVAKLLKFVDNAKMVAIFYKNNF